MRVQVSFEALSVGELRAVLAQCSREREAFPHSSQPWQPRVQCEGPDLFGVHVSPCPADVAKRILDAVGGTP